MLYYVDMTRVAVELKADYITMKLKLSKLGTGGLKMKIGYINRYDLKQNPHLTEKFKFMEANATRTINSRGDKVRSKMLMCPVDYEEIKDNADMMKENPQLIIVCEPFLLDDELREKCIKWVELANKADPSEYDPFAEVEQEG